MRKRFFASLLSLCMVVSLLPGTAFATGDGNVAKIGNTEYATLAQAVEAAQGGETITLLKDCSGGGIGTFQSGEGKILVKNFTIDFAGYTYTCTGPATGSAGTQSQAFHLEWNGDKDNNITI